MLARANARWRLFCVCFFALHLGNDLFRDRAGCLFVLLELHRVVRATLRGRPHMSGVTKHRAQRNSGLDRLRATNHLHTFDTTATAVQITDDRTHVLLGNSHFDRHHWLQQDRLRLAGSFLERHRTGDLEGHFVRVDIVIAAVIERNLDVHHLVASQNTTLHRILNTLVDRLDVLLRNRATLRIIGKLVTLTRLVGRDTDLAMSVVTRTASLTNVLAFGIRVSADRFAVVDLRLTNVGLDFVLTHHAVDDDLKVQFAHSSDDRLARIDIGADAERRIFLRELGKCHAHLFLVSLRLRLHSNLNNRRREVDRLEHNWVLIRADRVARNEILETNRGADITREDLGNLFTLVGVHLQQTANTLRLAGTRIQHRVAGLQLTRVDADEDQLTHKRVGHDLEPKRRERLVVISLADNLLFHIVGVVSDHGRNIKWARQVIDNRIEQRLNTLVLEGRTAEHRKDVHRDSRLTNSSLQLSLSRLLPLEEEVHDLVIRVRDSFNQISTCSLGLLDQISRDLFH